MTSLPDHAPSFDELARLYHELGKVGAPATGARRRWSYPKDVFDSREKLLALATKMLRYDARLLSILVQWVTEHWRAMNPVRVREHMARMRYPQTLCVVLEFVLEATHDHELFCRHVLSGWRPVTPAERFFIDSDRPASRIAQARAGRNLRAYERWGFIGTERPTVNAFTKQTIGRYGAEARRWILQRLAEQRGSFTLSDYLAALDHSISRQQALADLTRAKYLRLRGHGRGATWHRTPQARA